MTTVCELWWLLLMITIGIAATKSHPALLLDVLVTTEPPAAGT